MFDKSVPIQIMCRNGYCYWYVTNVMLLISLHEAVTHPLFSPQGNIKLLLDDIAQLRPTVFPSVPRVLNKLHDRISEGIGQKPAFVQWLIKHATSSKMSEVRQPIRACYLGHMTGYQSIRDRYFVVRSVAGVEAGGNWQNGERLFPDAGGQGGF